MISRLDSDIFKDFNHSRLHYPDKIHLTKTSPIEVLKDLQIFSLEFPTTKITQVQKIEGVKRASNPTSQSKLAYR